MKTATKPTDTLQLLGTWLRKKALVPCLGAATLLLTQSPALAGDVTWTFDTDPTLLTDPHPLKVYDGQANAFKDGTGTSVYWKDAGGDPGGFLGLTWPIGSSSAIVLFPDIDNGQLITAFKLDADLRIGNPQQADRAADGFSINFARSNDPVWANPDVSQMAVNGQPENGTSTGLAVSFDTWSGNTLPDGDGTDIEGIILRVDNVTVLKQSMPTRNGACNDPTSMQTGPKDNAYWAWARTNGFNQNYTAADTNTVPPTSPDLAFAPDSWSNLCWQHLSVELDINSKLTVTWKGQTILDHYQTTFFPSPGGIILAGRTGGADEHTHFDNLHLQTTAAGIDSTPPTVPSNVTATEVGATRVVLKWNGSTDASGRVAYEVSRGSQVLAATLTDTNFVDYPPAGGTKYTYNIRAYDVSKNYSAAGTLDVTTAPDANLVGTLRAEIFDNISGTAAADLLGSQAWNDNTPSRTQYALGGMCGSPNGLGGWNGSFGDSYGLKFTGVLTPSESGDYTFFIRSDDASQFYLNQSGADIPDPAFIGPDIEETGCCHTFLEPDDVYIATSPVTTATPITLTAGQSYGFIVILKEGGGGDGVAVGMRKAGDATPAANVPPISGLLVKGVGDPVDSVLNITQQPVAQSVIENEKTSFSVGITNWSHYTTQAWYQWTKNGKPVLGAQSATWNIPVVALADNNAQIACVVGTEGLVQTSSVVTLQVAADTKAPTVASASQSDGTFTTVTVKFSEPVTDPSATTTSNYTLDNGATVSAATLSADHFTVTLTTSALAVDKVYNLTINNVADNAGNPIAAATKVQFNSYVQVLPTAPKMEFYTGIGNTTVADLTGNAKFPNSPDSTDTSTNGLEIGSRNGNAGWNNSYGDNYGMRITGTLVAPGTGPFNFFIRSDDSSALWLNTSGSALPDITGAPIAQETGCCNAFQEPGTANQTTKSPINLVAGQAYGYVVLLKEGGGGDGVAVGMRAVGDTTPAGNLPSISTFMPHVTPAAAAPTVSVSRTGTTVTITYTGTLQSSTTVNGTYAPVQGASSPYTVPTGSAPAVFYKTK